MSGTNDLHLTQPTYSPREFAGLYTRHVRQVSYATVLGWIAAYEASGGKDGLGATRETRSGYYRIPAAEAERVLRKALGLPETT